MDAEETQWAMWMIAAHAGDRTAYHRLLTALVPVLRAIARHCLVRHGQDETDLDDIVQECLLALHLKRNLWDPSRPLVPWVRALVSNKCVDHLRRRGRHRLLPIEDFENVLPAPSPELIRDEPELQRLLAPLKGRSHDVLTAVAVQGLTLQAAAARLGISEGHARVALHRGLKQLSALVGRMQT